MVIHAYSSANEIRFSHISSQLRKTLFLDVSIDQFHEIQGIFAGLIIN